MIKIVAPAIRHASNRSAEAFRDYWGRAASAGAAERIEAAARAGALALWTDEHLVTLDDSRIDARPDAARAS